MPANDEIDSETDRNTDPVRPDAESTPSNPYRSPKTNVAPQLPDKNDLTASDWMLAIVLAGLAASLVFPATCLGAISLGIMHEIDAVINSGLFALVAAACVAVLFLWLRSNRESR